MKLPVREFDAVVIGAGGAPRAANPVIHEQDLQHEELLACYPERWVQLVKDIMEGKR